MMQDMFLYKHHFCIVVVLKTVVVAVAVTAAISSFTFASELEYVNVSRKELGMFLFLI